MMSRQLYSEDCTAVSAPARVRSATLVVHHLVSSSAQLVQEASINKFHGMDVQLKFVATHECAINSNYVVL
jgi:hypothetical protein